MDSAFAIFRITWMQLRHVRWIGLATCLLVPPGIVAGKALSEGKLPGIAMALGGPAHWSAYLNLNSLLSETLPLVVGAFLWPFLSLLMIVQALTVDRSQGTELFLHERPISRTRVWLARLAASLASVGMIVLSTCVGLSLVYIARYPFPADRTHSPYNYSPPGTLLGSVVVPALILGGVSCFLRARGRQRTDTRPRSTGPRRALLTVLPSGLALSLVWYVVLLAFALPRFYSPSRDLIVTLEAGGFVIFGALASGLFASSLGLHSIPTLMLGLLITYWPILLMIVIRMRDLSTLGDGPLSFLLFGNFGAAIVLIAVAWSVSCLGEPLGRGRLRRALITAVFATFLFLVAANFVSWLTL
jgi:hypothetical protein